jgi:hypothetical protein
VTRTTRKSVDHTIRHGVRSMLRSVPRRADFDVPNLATLVELRDDIDEAIAAGVTNLREQGHSWTVIGTQLGVSRQEAHRRYRS